MKRKNKIMMGSTISLASLFTVTTWVIGNRIYKKTVGRQPSVKSDEMVEFYRKREDRVLDKLDQYHHEKTFIESPKNGYEIEVLNIHSHEITQDAMIIVHGIGCNYHDILKTAFNYLNHGYHVLVYHQRHTGLTGGDNFTFGLYERFDLEAVVLLARELYPKGILGIHGFSMGAATATMHTELNEQNHNVNFYVLDGPYHTMESAIELGIKAENIPCLPVEYAKWAGNVVLKLKEHFNYKDIQPVNSVENISVPVLLIHGTEDRVTSPKSSQYIYDAIPHDNKELWYLQGAGHCKGPDLMEEEYFEKIYQFIDDYVK